MWADRVMQIQQKKVARDNSGPIPTVLLHMDEETLGIHVSLFFVCFKVFVLATQLTIYDNDLFRGILPVEFINHTTKQALKDKLQGVDQRHTPLVLILILLRVGGWAHVHAKSRQVHCPLRPRGPSTFQCEIQSDTFVQSFWVAAEVGAQTNAKAPHHHILH